MNKFYKAIKGTEVYAEYGEALIPYEAVAFEMNNAQRRQVEDATADDLAKAFNESGEFDPEIFEALLEMAEMDEEEIDRDEAEIEIEKRLGVKIS